ncbi:MAG: hypothetical protein RBU37_26420, partial [Myxococcota bacterium]|nr:hypothetical protein [Myxococcota bacterium]
MSHDLHFLQRLSRVTEEDQSLALSLYYDPDLVREIVALAPMPEDAERLAMALWFEPEGPHVVVSRAGHFVTCLGEGMSTGALPILTRHQLEGLKRRVTRVREALHVAQTTNAKRIRAMFRRLESSAAHFCREDFLLGAALAPLLSDHYLERSFRAAALAVELRSSMARVLRAGSLKLRRERQQVLELHQYFWTAAHYAVLSALSPSRIDIPDELADRFALGWTGIRSASVGVLTRTLWAAARWSDFSMRLARLAWSRCETPRRYYLALFSLEALALRHSGLRAEVLRALKRRELPATSISVFDQLLPLGLRVQLQDLTASLVSQGKAWKESQFEVLRQGPHREHCLVNGEFNQDLSDFRISGECELFSLPQFAPIVPLLIAFCVDFKPEQFYLPRSLLEGRAGTLSDEYLHA